MILGGKYLPHCRCFRMQVALNIIGTPAHKGSKICKWMTAQRSQHEVAAASMRAANHWFKVYGADKLRNIE